MQSKQRKGQKPSLTPAQKRNRRKVQERAYAKIAPQLREKNLAYRIRRSRLNRIQRQALRFIEGFWTPKQFNRQTDEPKRQQLRIYTSVLMQSPRYESSKREGRRQNALRSFLDNLFLKAA